MPQGDQTKLNGHRGTAHETLELSAENYSLNEHDNKNPAESGLRTSVNVEIEDRKCSKPQPRDCKPIQNLQWSINLTQFRIPRSWEKERKIS